VPQFAVPHETAGADRQRAPRLLHAGLLRRILPLALPCLRRIDAAQARGPEDQERAPPLCSRVSQIPPRAYDYPRAENAKKGADSQIANESLGNPHEMGTFSGIAGDRPSHRALRSWAWHSDDLEHELRDAAGALLARLESNAGRHRLTYPRTRPILSWGNLVEAMHRAEAMALAALPLDPATAARVKRDNAMPHPMGAPLSLEVLPVVDSPPIAPAEPFEGDPLEIPAFLRR